MSRHLRGITSNRVRRAWFLFPSIFLIPQVMTLKTLADVRKLLGQIPKERRQLSTWQHVEQTLQECAAGDDTENISVALQIVLQAERVPYQVCG
jgi:hypothetical protein